MLALINASVTEETCSALAHERGWRLSRVPSVRAAVAQLPEANRAEVCALIVEAEPVDGTLLAALPRLELLACLRADPVNVDIPAATERDVVVVNTPGRNAEAVADFTLGLCLASLRNIAIAYHGIMSRQLTSAGPPQGLHRADGDVIWRPDDPAAPVPYNIYRGHELSNLVLGVVGFGAVGRAVAHRFAGLVREIQVFDPAVAADVVSAEGCQAATLDKLLSAADVVTIHARSRSVVIGPAELDRMKPGSYLINTARASVLDYGALARALESGHLAGAALDVFPDEPLPASSPLLAVRGLTLTPHIAGAAVEVADRQSEILLGAVRGVYGNGTDWDKLPVCNPGVRARWAAGRAQGATGLNDG